MFEDLTVVLSVVSKFIFSLQCVNHVPASTMCTHTVVLSSSG